MTLWIVLGSIALLVLLIAVSNIFVVQRSEEHTLNSSHHQVSRMPSSA